MNTGVITVTDASGNQKSYIERFQVFPSVIQVASNGQVMANLNIALPGTYSFRLKMLTRDVLATVNSVQTRVSRPFMFRLGNSDGTSWFMGGQTLGSSAGIATNRILDTNILGTGQFPYPIVPDILFPPSSNIVFDVEDVSQNAPYTIYFAYHGAYLVPVQ